MPTTPALPYQTDAAQGSEVECRGLLAHAHFAHQIANGPFAGGKEFDDASTRRIGDGSKDAFGIAWTAHGNDLKKIPMKLVLS